MEKNFICQLFSSSYPDMLYTLLFQALSSLICLSKIITSLQNIVFYDRRLRCTALSVKAQFFQS